MSANKYDISQIRKYLSGELDARAMYELERQAQDDPFLMDLMMGMETATEGHQPNLDAIDQLIKQRVQQDKARVIPIFKYWPAAASLLIAIGIGAWWLNHQTSKPLVAVVTTVVKPSVKDAVTEPQVIKPVIPLTKNTLIAKIHKSEVKATAPAVMAEEPPSLNAMVAIQPKTDSTYLANNLAKAQKAEPNTLKEVRITGYPAQARRDVVASAQIVANPPDTGINKALMGRVAGVAIAETKLKEIAANTITGNVVDDKGEPLAGAIVKVNGTQQAISTDVNGGFKLNVPASNQILDVTSIGYVGQQVMVNNRDNLKIVLGPASASLSEVVVVGYGTQKRTNVTGNNTTAAYPVVGWAVYNQYLSENAIMPDGSTGVVELGFKVGIDLKLSDIRIINSPDKAMGDRAIDILKSGSKWMGGDPSKETRLKIIFHKRE